MGMGLEENEDPFKGISDLPGFEQGYEGVDRKDELMEDVSLASELSALDFEDVKSPLGDDISSTVSDKGIKGGADSQDRHAGSGRKSKDQYFAIGAGGYPGGWI
jgi:hypothetical protein